MDKLHSLLNENKSGSVLQNRLRDTYEVFTKDNIRVYIFGTGKLGRFAYKQCEKNGIKVEAFVDNDTSKIGTFIDEIPVIYRTELGKDAKVIIASSSWWRMKYQLEELGIPSFLYYEELAIIRQDFEHYNEVFENWYTKYDKSRGKISEIYNLLQDEVSKEIFYLTWKFRLTLDVECTRMAKELSEEHGIQYFDECVTKNDREVFLDGGGFIGDSSLEFVKWIGDNDYKIYFFEPDNRIIEKAKCNLSKIEQDKIIYYQAAIGREKSIVCYSEDFTGGGYIGDGDLMVDVYGVDQLGLNDVTFLKLDVEGYELEALKGAERLIKEKKPKLAISIYHKYDDFYELIKYVLSLRNDYKIYIRHYTKAYGDTVCYFV